VDHPDQAEEPPVHHALAVGVAVGAGDDSARSGRSYEAAVRGECLPSPEPDPRVPEHDGASHPEPRRTGKRRSRGDRRPQVAAHRLREALHLSLGERARVGRLGEPGASRALAGPAEEGIVICP